MKAPEHWVDRLEAYDRNLEFRWDNREKRWQIWHKATTRDRPYRVLTVQTPHNNYCPIDNRTFDLLRRCDAARFRNWREHLASVDTKFEAKQKEKERQLEDYVEMGLGDAMAWGIKRDLD